MRLLTYNIHSGVGLDGVLDLGRIADVIESAGADVVAVQEVDRFRREQSRFEDQPGGLAQRLGMHLAYAANLDDEPAHPGAPRAQYGTALLSRLPFESSTNTLLPCFDGSEQRGLPTVLLGDLNTTPGSPAYRCLEGRLVDVWTLVGEGEGRTFDAEPPARRIDYVGVGGGVAALSAKVLPSVASDHSALLVEVRLPG